MVSEERITNGALNTSPAGQSQLVPVSWTCGHNTSYASSYCYSTNNIVHSSSTCLIIKTTSGAGDWASAEQSVDLTGVTNITFWYYCDRTTCPPLSVIIDSTTVYTLTSYTKNAWTQVTIPISGFSGLHTLKFYESVSASLYIRVDDVSALATVLANFTVSNSTPMVNIDTVTFTNTSQGASSYLWDFGDGTTSTLQSPTKMYTSGGVKTVTLKINGQTTGDYVKTATITVQDPRMLVRSGIEWL